jgi:hypothetical protein
MTKISDNKNLQRLMNDANTLEQISDILYGFNVELDSRIRELSQKTKGLASIADEFNEKFSKYGWIASEDMSVPLMEQAVKTFSEYGIEKAEDFICKSFDDAYFSLHSHRMQALWVWKDTPRSRLLNLAYIDHKEGRYHASIPVVLAQIDGLSFDTNRKSFFDKKSALIIENSIAAHESGLRNLSDRTSKQRTKTLANPLNFPYRHGILHGRELAYDNELVSAKCFFTLFAMRPWALKCQKVEFDKQAGHEYEKILGFESGDLLAEKVKALLKK